MSLRQELQKDLFQHQDERIVWFMEVCKTGKKKKPLPCFLCLSVTTERPINSYLHYVKRTEKDSLKKKYTWPLKEIRTVDGKNDQSPEIDFLIDKPYKWVANSLSDKHMFVVHFWKLSSKTMKTRPNFLNFPVGMLEDVVDGPLISGEQISAGSLGEEMDENYQALTEKEENDLVRMMDKCDFAISNAEAFMDQLSRDLSVLDGENISSIMGSEEQVSHLMNLIQKAIDECQKFENRLDIYDDVLQRVRETMEHMEEKTHGIHRQNTNNKRLMEELDRIISLLEVSPEHQHYLTDPNFSSPDHLEMCTAAANALKDAMNANIHPCLVRMSAVQEQKKRFERWRTKFAQALSRHMNNLFIQLGNEQPVPSSFEMRLPAHTIVYTTLKNFEPLMHWMKIMDKTVYEGLIRSYCNALGKLYERNIKWIFEEARKRSVFLKERKNQGQTPGSSEKSKVAVLGPQLGKLQGQAGLGVKGSSPAFLGSDPDVWTSEKLDIVEVEKFDETFKILLSQLEFLCNTEQEFCTNFFQLSHVTPDSHTTLDVMSSPNSTLDLFQDTSPSAQKKANKLIHGEIRRIMTDLFFQLEPEFCGFVNQYSKLDTFLCMVILVRLTDYSLNAQDTGSFLSMLSGSTLIHVKRNYDKNIVNHLKSIDDVKVIKKKCGIISFVLNFEDFVKLSETIYRDIDRRADIEKSYWKVTTAIFNGIDRIADEHQKTPPEVVRMENYHHMHSVIAQSKVRSLEKEKKEAKDKYNESLQSYVTKYFGRPLEKVFIFFDGVQQKVNAGVKESEISYQLAFSKQELRKVLSQYPGKEVCRGLESLYHKVNKHLCEEENLIQVVWRAMLEEFIKQYKTIEDWIRRCYPGAMVSLEFSTDDVLSYFSTIAQHM